MVAARSWAWSAGGSSGFGRYFAAKVEINTAPAERTLAHYVKGGIEKLLTDAHWAKVTTENRFSEGLDIRDPLIESYHNGQPSKQEDKDSDHDQPPYTDGEIRLLEVGEGHPCSDINETRYVE